MHFIFLQKLNVLMKYTAVGKQKRQNEMKMTLQIFAPILPLSLSKIDDAFFSYLLKDMPLKCL